MRLWVAIATVGRPDIVGGVIECLGRQTRQPDGVVVASVHPDDVKGLPDSLRSLEIVFSEKGLCRQRNRAMEYLRHRADIVVFFDDDFVPSDYYLQEIEADFARDANLVGATGRLIADGIHNKGYSITEALEMIKGDQAPQPPVERPTEALYGCNMAIRMSAADGLQFDEALPLYGWLEDIDFTYRLGQRGRLVRSQRYSGVHMGVKSGRTPGRKLGYSQLANPVYLLKKKSIPRRLAFMLMRQNLTMNIVRSLWPEPDIDRRGRLLGNLFALWDIIRHRSDPQRVVSM